MRIKTTMKNAAESSGVPPTGIFSCHDEIIIGGICGSLKGTQCAR
jgi:hypothetical protein